MRARGGELKLCFGLVALAISGCDLQPTPCVDANTCCAAWSRLVGGSCVARRWSSSTTLSDGSQPRIAVGQNGSVAVAWLDGARHVRVAREDGGYEDATPGGPAAFDPVIGVSRIGTPTVLWQSLADDGTSSIRHGVWQDGWQWPEQPLSVGTEAAEPTLAIGVLDEVLASWVQWTGVTWGVAVASIRYRGIDGPAHVNDVLSPPINFANYPVVAANPRGQASITWFQDTTDRLMTFVSQRPANSLYFSRPTPEEVVSPLGAPVDRPLIAIDHDGRLAVAWRQENGAGAHAVYLSSQDERGWHTPSSLEDTFSHPVDLVHNVQLAFTQGGDLYVVWQQNAEGVKTVHVAHRDPDGRWIASGRDPVQLSAPGMDAFDPSLAAGANGVVVSWTELVGEASRIVTRRSHTAVRGDESARWGTPTILSRGELGVASQVAMGGNDRVAVVWIQDGAVTVATID